MNELYCNNCKKVGHLYSFCKMPITSFGVIVYRIHPIRGTEYLMICRKDTLGYIDFMRGKYPVNNIDCIMNLVDVMTLEEKDNLKTLSFEQLWTMLWNNKDNLGYQYKMEERYSREKFLQLKAEHDKTVNERNQQLAVIENKAKQRESELAKKIEEAVKQWF